MLNKYDSCMIRCMYRQANKPKKPQPSRVPSRQVLQKRVTPRQNRPSGGSAGMRLVIGLVMAGIALFSYFNSSQVNEITGETQYLSLSQEQEIALGLQAVPQLIQQHGGLEPNEEDQQWVDEVGERLVRNSIAADADYPFEFHLLADDQTVNAFALPGGPIFITTALFHRLETEGQLAGVLGHEIAHVIARHGAQRIAKQELTEGLNGAVVMATYDPENPESARTAQMAHLIGNVVNMSFGREDELESDYLGIIIMAEAGYDPRALIGVMEILEEATGGSSQPEFFSTHPNPENRIGKIETAIAEIFPEGVPDNLAP